MILKTIVLSSKADPDVVHLLAVIARQLTRIADILEEEPAPPEREPTSYHLSVSGQQPEPF